MQQATANKTKPVLHWSRKMKLRQQLQLASRVAELPLRNRERVQVKLSWGKTKWGARDQRRS